MNPQITAIYAAICALLITSLGIRVVKSRRKNKVGLGSGDCEELEAAVRIHGNAIENIPLVCLLMLIYELNSGNLIFLHICGTTLVLGRLLHAKGLSLSRGTSFGRVAGAGSTWLITIALAIANLVKVFTSP